MACVAESERCLGIDEIADLALDVVSAIRRREAGLIDTLLLPGALLQAPFERPTVMPASGEAILVATSTLAPLAVGRIATAPGMALIEYAGWREGTGGGLLICHLRGAAIAEVLVFCSESAGPVPGGPGHRGQVPLRRAGYSRR